MQSLAHRTFWVAVVIGCALKLILVADMDISLVNSPTDDLLYVSQAESLLKGEALGKYSDKTFLKVPGFAFLLAGIRSVGLPYITALNLGFLGAVVSLARVTIALGFSPAIGFLLFAVLAFHPLTLSHEWTLLLREPTSCVFTLFLLATWLWIFHSLKERRGVILPLLTHSLFFLALLLLREEEKLLYAVEGLSLLPLCSLVPRNQRLSKAFALSFPILFALVGTYGLETWISKQYGLPILHELSEGEYPKLFQEIFRIPPLTRNLHQTLTPEATSKLKAILPEIGPVIDRAMAEHRPGDEGTFIFRFREQLFRAGRTPHLVAAQNYYAALRERIALACDRDVSLQCSARRSQLFPPFSWKDVPLLTSQASKLFGIALDPKMTLIEDAPDLGLPNDAEVMAYRNVTRSPIPTPQIRYGTWTTVIAPAKPVSYASEVASRIFECLRWMYPKWIAVSLCLLVLRILLFGVRLNGVRAGIFFFPVVYVVIKLAALSYVTLSLTAAVRLFYPISFVLLFVAFVGLSDLALTLNRIFVRSAA